MGTLLDAQALVALLSDEPAATDVEALVRAGAGMTAVNLAEAVAVLMRFGGITEDELRGLVQPLGLLVGPVSEPLAWRAAALRARHYRGKQSPVSLADCFLVAGATPTDRVATADRAVLRMAAAEGVPTVALPDSSGRRP